MRLVVIGAGELGARVARAWDGPVVAVTRSTTRHDVLRGPRLTPTTQIPRVEPSDRLLLAVPGSAAQAEVIGRLATGTAPERVVLIGTTGIHGGYTGTVGPRTPSGTTPRAQTAAAAEAALWDWTSAAVVLRCGGLYRGGRGPFSALARTRSARLGPPDAPLPLIHYADAAAAALAALLHPDPRRVYVGVTPPVPTRAEFYAAATAALDMPPIAFGPALGGEPVTFDVSGLRADLLPVPAHPDWRDAIG